MSGLGRRWLSRPRAARRAGKRSGIAGWGPLLVVAALAWRAVRYALVFPMWGDEGMLAVNLYDRTFVGLLDPLDYRQVAPAGFLWLELAARKLLGFTEPALRFVPFLAGVGAVFLFWRLSRKLLDRRSALFSMAVFAASFYPLRYAAEVKPYSMDFLLAVAILLAAWGIRERPAASIRWSAFAALGAVSAWLSYPSIFVSGGACVWLLWRGRETEASAPRWPWVLAAGSLICAAFLAMYVLAGAGQRAAAPAAYWSAGFPPMSEPWRIPLWAVEVHTGMMLAYPNGGHSGGSTVSLLLAVLGGFVLWRARRPALLLLLSPLPLMFLAAALRLYPYGGSARVAQHVAPAACLLIGTGIVRLLRKVVGGRKTIAAAPYVVLTFLIVVVAGIALDIMRPYHTRADHVVRAVVSELARDSAPGDTWIAFASRDDGQGAPRYSKLVGMGGRIHFQLLRYAPGPLLWAPRPGSAAVSPSANAWLIAYGNRVFEPDGAEWDAYVREMSGAMGRVPQSERHDLPNGEWIEVVRLSVE